MNVDIFQAPGKNPNPDNTARISGTVDRIKNELKDNPNFEFKQECYSNKWQAREDSRKNQNKNDGITV